MDTDATRNQATSPSTDGLLFDVDGTLIDTRQAILAALRHAFRTVVGVSFPRTDEEIRWALAARIAETCRHVSSQHADACEQAYHAYYAQGHDPVPAFPGVAETLAELQRHGIPIGIVTNKSVKRLSLDLHRTGLDEIEFDVVVCAEDTAERKPHPRPLEIATERAGFDPSRTIYVGDGPHDIEAAHRAGMVGVGAAYGYYDSQALRDEMSDYIIECINEVLHLPMIRGQQARRMTSRRGRPGRLRFR